MLHFCGQFTKQNIAFLHQTFSLKPVLNWANVCLPDILQTLWRTMICFLTELLVRRTWFRQFKEFTCSQLACNKMQTSAWTCGRHAADSMIKNVKSIYFNHPSQGNSTNYYLILGLRNKAAPPANQQIPSEESDEPSATVIHFYFYFFFIHRRALLSANQRQCSSIRANVPRTCWAKLFGPRI